MVPAEQLGRRLAIRRPECDAEDYDVTVRMLSIQRIKVGGSVHVRHPSGASGARNAPELHNDEFRELSGIIACAHHVAAGLTELQHRPVRRGAAMALRDVIRRETRCYLGQEH